MKDQFNKNEEKSKSYYSDLFSPVNETIILGKTVKRTSKKSTLKKIQYFIYDKIVVIAKGKKRKDGSKINNVNETNLNTKQDLDILKSILDYTNEDYIITTKRK